MTEQEWHSIEGNFSFADSELLSFSYDEKKQVLKVFLELWNEEKIELQLRNVSYFLYRTGDLISEIYEKPSCSLIMEESDNYQNKLEFIYRKLIEFRDINDFSVIKVLCNEFSIFTK